MEFMLHFWDELDDAASACRHVTVSTVEEVAEFSGAFAAAVMTFALSALRPPIG